jgi:hypothetical protein
VLGVIGVRKELRWKVSENKWLRRIFTLKREEGIGRWRK